LTLNGEAGSAVTVNLAQVPPVSGFSITPTTVTFASGQSTATFTVKTPTISSASLLNVTATMPAQGSYAQSSVSGTLFVDAFGLTAFTLTPNSIASGAQATGTVTISQPAPTGGVVVGITSSNSAVASVPTTVTVAQGASTVTFPITGGFVDSNKAVTITATRGTTVIKQSLTVQQLVLAVSVNPSELIGGNPSVGTVTIASPAPSGGLPLTLASSNSDATLPAKLTIPAGATSANFNISTVSVGMSVTAKITATFSQSSTTKSTSPPAYLVLDPIGIQSLTFTPSTVMENTSGTAVVILSGPAPKGGATVTLTPGSFVTFPTLTGNKLVIPAGSTSSAPFKFTALSVSRNLSTSVTASYSGGSAIGTLNINR
jgi:hypothetical protein